MDEKRITVRMTRLIFDAIMKETQKSIDALGFKHLSMNSWILMAVVEKLQRENLPPQDEN